jgi:nitroimidazol reductase NimA-like FMN-containing flavoprotein (pyridoxamine 5'-phosphate oxidase superfamily)
MKQPGRLERRLQAVNVRNRIAQRGEKVSAELKKTDRTKISRHDERGSYDREIAYAILDEGLVAHVGLDTGNGVMVIPMTYARMGDELILHGAVASRWLSSFAEGRPISVCVTLLDGLVLAQSAFSHSMNYRSVVAFGEARVITDPEKKEAAFTLGRLAATGQKGNRCDRRARDASR